MDPGAAPERVASGSTAGRSRVVPWTRPIGTATGFGIRAVIECPRQPCDDLCIVAEVDHGSGVGSPTAGAVRSGIEWQVRRLGQPFRQAGNKHGEALDRGLVALGIERKRGLIRRDVEQALCQDATRIHGVGHDMPCHAILRRAVEQCPHRSIEPTVEWQRPVVKIDRSRTGEGDDVGRNNGEVGDAEQEIES